MAPLPGLNVSNGQSTDAGILESHSIGDLNPEHGSYGSSEDETWPAAFGTGYQGTTYGPDIHQGDMPPMNQGGEPIDATPTAHSAPYTRGISQPNLEEPGSYRDSADEVTRQRNALHGLDYGGPRFYNKRAPGGREEPVNYTVDRYDAPNTNDLAQIPGQLKGGSVGGGMGKDTTQGYGHLNSTEEFTRGHSIRIVQHDTVHFDHTLSNSPPRPFNAHVINTGNSFNVDGPYGEVAGDTSTGQQIPWEGRIGNPTTYQQPSQPTVNQPSQGGADEWPAW